MKYGLPAPAIETIIETLSKYPQVERAILYGSRAMGNYRPGSDIDLTLIGDDLDAKKLGEIAGAFDELPIPYTMDLSLHAQLKHPDLREHIARVGVVFYERNGD